MLAEMKAWSKVGLLIATLAAFTIVGLLFRGDVVHLTKCECNNNQPEQTRLDLDLLSVSELGYTPSAGQTIHKDSSNSQPVTYHSMRWLSYQPPGNGWNNQRIALENALVLARLLNRSLIVHPLAPHELGNRIKQVEHLRHGYVAYNLMEQSDLLPLSAFMDLKLMSEVTPVIEAKTSHKQFLSDYSHLTWRNICHTGGFGYWMDQVPEHTEEVAIFAKQKFSSLGSIWREKCPEEKTRVEKASSNSALVRFVSDLQNDPSEMLYFEQGTLFGIHIRFSTYEKALEAQTWVVDYVRYSSEVWARAKQVADQIGGFFKYNAIQVRRKNHMDSKLPPSFWIEQMVERNFSTSTPVYIATNDVDPKWFQPFIDAGFKLYFSSDFPILDFKETKASLRSDFLGIHEQCICEKANKFIQSPASTFNAFILRHRGEVKMQDELMMESLHTYWIGHQIDYKIKKIRA